jgi:hypothetical protein
MRILGGRDAFRMRQPQLVVRTSIQVNQNIPDHRALHAGGTRRAAATAGRSVLGDHQTMRPEWSP